MSSPDEMLEEDAGASALSARATSAAAAAGADAEAAAASTSRADDTPPFPGDTGQLPIETRRVLVQLLLGPSVDVRRHSRLWPVLVRDERLIRSRLHELFLELIVDPEQRGAFTRQIASEEADIPILLRKTSLTFLESAMLLFLRRRLTQADAQGERAVLSHEEIKEHLSVYERSGNPDHARFERQILNAIEKGKKLSLLQRIRGSDERYEISPTLKLLFSAEDIQALTNLYAGLKADDASIDITEDAPPES